MSLFSAGDILEGSLPGIKREVIGKTPTEYILEVVDHPDPLMIGSRQTTNIMVAETVFTLFSRPGNQPLPNKFFVGDEVTSCSDPQEIRKIGAINTVKGQYDVEVIASRLPGIVGIHYNIDYDYLERNYAKPPGANPVSTPHFYAGNAYVSLGGVKLDGYSVNAPCLHVWKHYLGTGMNPFYFCEKCDEKKKEL